MILYVSVSVYIYIYTYPRAIHIYVYRYTLWSSEIGDEHLQFHSTLVGGSKSLIFLFGLMFKLDFCKNSKATIFIMLGQIMLNPFVFMCVFICLCSIAKSIFF